MQTALLLIVAALLLLYALPHLAPGWPRATQTLRQRLTLPAAPPIARRQVESGPPMRQSGTHSIAQRWLGVSDRIAIAVLTGSLVVGLLLQQWLTYHPSWFALAVVPVLLCGIVTALLIPGPRLLCEPLLRAAPASSWLECGAAGVGVICALIGAAQLRSDVGAAQLWWVAGMAISVLGLLPQRLRWPALDRVEVAVIAGLFLLALLIRLPALTDSPPFVHGDEAMGGIYARLFNSGAAPLLSIGWHSLPMASYALLGVGLRLFGDTLTGLRMINVVIGSAAVVLAYLLGRELFGRWAALLSALLLTVSFLHVDLSRSGLHDIQGPTCVTLTTLLAVRWLRTGGALTALLAGMSITLDIQMHWAARVAPVLLVALLIFIAVRERELWALRRRESGWLAVGIVVSCAPLAALWALHRADLFGRDGAILILNPSTVPHDFSVYGTTAPLVIFLNQLWRTWATFYVRGDASTLIDRQGGMFDTVSAALLVPALALFLLRWKSWQYAVILGWFGAVCAASVLTIDPPWWPRLAALLPAAALCLGVLLAELARVFRQVFVTRRRWVTAGLCVALLCIAVGNLRLVYVEYPAAERQSPLMEGTLVGRFLATAPGDQNTDILSDGSLYVNSPPIRFLAPQAGGCTLPPDEPLQDCPPARLYVLLPGRVDDLSALKKQRPGGHTVTVGSYNHGASQILAYELP